MMTLIVLKDDVKRLWAKSKPRHPLWKHMLDASAVSFSLSQPLTSFGWKPEAIALLVGLHDIGKVDSCFQHQILDFSSELIDAGYCPTNDARCRHERISAWFIKKKLVSDGIDNFTADAIARTVIVHHGYWNEAARDVAPKYAKAQDQLCQMLQQVVGVEAFPDENQVDLSAFGIRLAGHIVLSDWIASNEDFFGDPRLKDIDDPEAYFKKAKEIACEWIAKLDLKKDTHEGNAANIVEKPRPIQKKLLENDIPPGLIIIEAPMGEGKTEAAWILAEKWRDKGYHGMYMALPTMATSDSLHRRYRDDYLVKLDHGKDVKLVHGMAWLRDEKEPEKLPQNGEPGDDQSFAAAWFRPTRRAMLGAHGVGTVDQAMLAGMNVKFGFLRLSGLADRVLVIDEVHAYDAYMSAIIARLLQWCACLKIPVVLLSATLSAKQRVEMIEAYGAADTELGTDTPYPLITVVDMEKKVSKIKSDASSSWTLKVETPEGLLGNAKKTAVKAVELVKDDGCCCVILNTVKQAQAVFKELEAIKFPAEERLLFHARFAASDREEITQKVLDLFGKGRWKGEDDERRFIPPNRPKKYILVATQVVEQSLDVDFDHMISELAPIDLLLQRSGRIKRHSRDKNGNLVDGLDQRGEPLLHILVPTTEGSKPPKIDARKTVYQEYPLQLTLEVLSDKKQVELPKEFRPLIEAVYGKTPSSDAPEDQEGVRLAWNIFQQDIAAQAGQFLLCEPMSDEFDPVGADEVGDDSDDGNGWRAQTRLGMEDVLVIPIDDEELQGLINGDVDRNKVKELYKSSVKIPPKYWPPKPAKGYGTPVLGSGRLRGVWLLPVKREDNGWSWSGIKDDKKTYVIRYNRIIGIEHGGEK